MHGLISQNAGISLPITEESFLTEEKVIRKIDSASTVLR